MKYAIRFIAVIGFVMIFSSCDRNYSCSCTYLQNGLEASLHEDIKGSQSHALHECSLRETELKNSGGTNVRCGVPI